MSESPPDEWCGVCGSLRSAHSARPHAGVNCGCTDLEGNVLPHPGVPSMGRLAEARPDAAEPDPSEPEAELNNQEVSGV